MQPLVTASSPSQVDNFSQLADGFNNFMTGLSDVSSHLRWDVLRRWRTAIEAIPNVLRTDVAYPHGHQGGVNYSTTIAPVGLHPAQQLQPSPGRQRALVSAQLVQRGWTRRTRRTPVRQLGTWQLPQRLRCRQLRTVVRHSKRGISERHVRHRVLTTRWVSSLSLGPPGQHQLPAESHPWLQMGFIEKSLLRATAYEPVRVRPPSQSAI